MNTKQTQQKKITHEDIEAFPYELLKAKGDIWIRLSDSFKITSEALADQRKGYVDALKQELKLSRFGEGHNKGILTAIKLIEQEEEPTR